ncbi:MAG: hypothetical protein COZ06_37395 [Armatimonadetes bacterium CG_4_10_14_3_um_filter_66_18]|nr:MAG: hypothetical protein COS65_04155 [Armatimonadetes bacterium CG06_land_8_20_14_3_00_66_21]PIX36942.1 MAG: hypothetical protein COZ57_36925 [Armatimonadetes bacterium CG_4_8_14_3_um_filter_66_20]PIY35895.1 MAG: hypothetical protein COZ06_37395 [Armatimonadetes bacterium CG_4_10_14_3_um_filter_66_18]PIZ43502.1 MAG: hypothetical protein COY42_15735 [Armatimonadetes bacterium CG_4_10_14_0_8_um_filter_66_14]
MHGPVRIANLVVGSGPTADRCTPLGALTIAAAVRETGAEVLFDDYQFIDTDDRWQPEAIARFLSAEEVAVLGISAYEHVLPHLVLACDLMKSNGFQGALVLGGPGPSSVAQELVSRFPSIDAVVVGDGEEPIQRLLTTPRSEWSQVAGVFTAAGGTTRKCEPKERETVSPAYDLVSGLDYDRFYLSTSRGCPYSCPYCTVPSQWGGRFAERPSQKVLSEVRYLTECLNVRRIHIADDGFTALPRRAVETARAMQEICADVEWSSYVNLSRVDEELLHELADLGCFSVFAGFESGSEALLKRLGRPQALRTMARTVAALRDRLWIDCSLMWGYPDESVEDFYETLMTGVWLSELGESVWVRLFQLAPLAAAALTKDGAGQLRFVQGETSGLIQTTPEQLSDPIVRLIAAHPDVFSAYCRFDTPQGQRKRELLREMDIFGPC